ncbi:hypothetical protein LZ31DRAFT_559852 [Colletotrichum somersetense]|nr:hypothetical protein LZ31DRAFT_559852 [Colletotrichum somersetense]
MGLGWLFELRRQVRSRDMHSGQIRDNNEVDFPRGQTVCVCVTGSLALIKWLLKCAAVVYHVKKCLTICTLFFVGKVVSILQ